MKHYSDDSKKLIKNVVSLAVSALLLAAATFAWFYQQSSDVSVGVISASVTSEKVVTYARMAPDTSFLDFAIGSGDATNASRLNTAGGVRIRTRSNENNGLGTYTDISSYLIAKTGNADWIRSGNDSTVVDNNNHLFYTSNLIPGAYEAYRISYSGDQYGKKLAFKTLTVDGLTGLADSTIQGYGVTSAEASAAGSYSAALRRKILESIRVYAFLRTKTGDEAEWSAAGSTLDTTLYALEHPAVSTDPGLSNVLTSNAASGTLVEMYYVIGMPANETALQDVIRQVGATVTISTIELDDIAGS